VGFDVGFGVGVETCGVTWRVTGFGLTAGTLVWTTISWELGVDTWTGVCTTAVAWEAGGGVTVCLTGGCTCGVGAAGGTTTIRWLRRGWSAAVGSRTRRVP
jgi:hypothetical protein